MWLRTKTDSGSELLINFDHVTHVFGNPYGSLIVLDNNEQSIGVPDTLPEIHDALSEIHRDQVWISHR